MTQEKQLTTAEIISMIEDGEYNLYVRYSSGPEVDRGGSSRNHQTGEVEIEYGLSTNALINWDKELICGDYFSPPSLKFTPNLAVTNCIGLEKYVKMQIRDYGYLPGRPWIMRAERIGTGSDNEPIVDSRTFEFLGYWQESK
jgi:hypothetical protein